MPKMLDSLNCTWTVSSFVSSIECDKFTYLHLQSYMDSEIMAIMSQYMPLDNQHNNRVQTAEAEPLRQGSV